MALYTRSITLPASPCRLWRFHENPRNLRIVAPSGMNIRRIEAKETAAVGEQFTVVVQTGPFVLRWTGQWQKVDPPSVLVDTGVECPFSFWQHEHLFEPAHDDSGTVMTDRVTFRLPTRRGGRPADWVLARFVFPVIFAGRHRAMLDWLQRERA